MKARPDKHCNRNPIVIVEDTGSGINLDIYPKLFL